MDGRDKRLICGPMVNDLNESEGGISIDGCPCI